MSDLAPFEVRDTAFHSVIPADTRLEVVADGFVFTEGPIWHPNEHYLVFSDIITSKQYRWSQDGGLRVFRQPSNMANGNCFDLEGRIVSCEHAHSRVVRHDYDGRLVQTLVDRFEGQDLNSPNDIVCDSSGRLWFTDPSFGRFRDDVGYIRDQELDFQGVYRLDPNGTLTCIARDFQQPNGLCLSLDERQLFVNDSADPCIRVFDVADDGSVTGGDRWAEVTGEQEGRKWVPDGMKIALSGHLFCNGPNGVHVFNADAQCLGVIRLPEKSTNFCFGGPDRTDLFITASSRVYRIATEVQGPSMIHGLG